MVKNGLFGAELQRSKKIRKSTLEPYICLRKKTALKCNLYLKNYKTLLKNVKFVPYYIFVKAAITAKKGQKWTVPAQT